MPEPIQSVPSIYTIAGAFISFLGVIIGIFLKRQIDQTESLKKAEKAIFDNAIEDVKNSVGTLFKKHDENVETIKQACSRLSHLSGKFDMLYQDHLMNKGNCQIKITGDDDK